MRTVYECVNDRYEPSISWCRRDPPPPGEPFVSYLQGTKTHLQLTFMDKLGIYPGYSKKILQDKLYVFSYILCKAVTI